MIYISLRKAFVFPLLLCAWSVNAGLQIPSPELLIKQCRDLSMKISTLVKGQKKGECIDKLDLASSQMNLAGERISAENYPFARKELASAIYALQYAELSVCNYYIQISHSKLEAKKIRQSLSS